MLTPFVTNAEVRGVLGVTEEELPDATLNLQHWERQLRFEFAEIGDNLVADFEIVEAIAESSRTAVQARFYDAVLLFAPFAVGKALALGLPLFAPKSVTDGKAAVSRNAESPFEDQINRCKQEYERFRQNLKKRYTAYGGTPTDVDSAVPALFLAVAPASDPVTGT